MKSAVRAAAFGGHIKTGIEGVKIIRVQIFLHAAQRFTETLEMDDFPFPEEFDGIGHFGDIFHQPQDVIVGGAGFLFWGDLVKTTYKNTRKNR